MQVSWIAIFVISLCFRETPGDITDAPINTAVIAAQQVILNCSIENDMQLWVQDYSIGPIAINANVQDSYKGIYEIFGQYNLVLLVANYNTSGAHICYDLIGNKRRSADIIVLGSDPVCTSNGTNVENIFIEGEYIQYVCVFYYQGKWAPVMNWAYNNGENIVPEMETDGMNYPAEVMYVFVKELGPVDQGSFVKVLTFFEEPTSPGEDSATNAPAYVHEWHFPSITIHYRPNIVIFHHCNGTICTKIGNDDSEISIQQMDVIIANADSNPPLDYYIWMNGTEKLSEGPFQNQTLFENNGTFVIGCIVRNTMRDGIQAHTRRNILVIVNGPKSVIINAPLNTAVIKGQGATLECSVENAILRWSEDTYGTISNNENVHDEYKDMYGIEGRYNLVLLVAQYNTSGKYICYDVIGAATRVAEMIVLGSDPECSTNASITNNILLDGEYIQYVCSLRYKGKWSPTMDWIANDGSSIIPEIETNENDDAMLVTYSFARVINPTDEGLSVKVITSFDEPTFPGEDSATNAPYYFNVWNSPTISVHHTPKLIIFYHCNETLCNKIGDDVLEISLQPMDSIRAAADANPAIDYYIWMVGSEKYAEGPDENEFVIKTNGTFLVISTVRNTIRGGMQTHLHRNMLIFVGENIVITPDPVPTSDPKKLTGFEIFGVVTSVLVIVGLVASIILFRTIRIHRKKKDALSADMSSAYNYTSTYASHGSLTNNHSGTIHKSCVYEISYMTPNTPSSIYDTYYDLNSIALGRLNPGYEDESLYNSKTTLSPPDIEKDLAAENAYCISNYPCNDSNKQSTISHIISDGFTLEHDYETLEESA